MKLPTLTLTCLAMSIVAVNPAHATCDNAQIDDAFNLGGATIFLRGTRAYIFNHALGWQPSVDQNSPNYWSAPNGPFQFTTERVDAAYDQDNTVVVVRGTTAYVWTGQWQTPIDLNTPLYWRQPGAPFEGGDTRRVDATYKDGDYVTVYRETKAYLFHVPTGTWTAPVELNSATYWAQPNAPFASSTAPIHAAYVMGNYVTILRNTASQRQAFIFEISTGRWLTPYTNLENIWNGVDAPYQGGRVVISCDKPVGGTEGTVMNPVGAAGVGASDSGGVPASPSNLVVDSVTTTSVTLKWKDNAAVESGFVLYRDEQQAATTGSNTTTLTVTGLQPGFGYCFSVRARNGSSYSPHSNEVCTVTTSSGPTGKVEVNVLRPIDGPVSCGTTPVTVAGQTKQATGTWTGYAGTGHCIYPVQFDKIPVGRHTVSATDMVACGTAYVDSAVTWFMRLDWHQLRCQK